MKKIKTLSEIIKIIKKNKSFLLNSFGVKDIAIFGSYARKEQRKNSDLDIFVELKNSYQTFDNFMDLKFFLQKCIGKKIDIATKEAIREELKSKIFRDAIHV